MLKKIAISRCIAVVVAMYTTLVLQNLWNWFVVNAFHTSEISFSVMFGLTIVVGLLVDQDDATTHQQLKGLMMMMEAMEVCLPADKKEDLDEKFKEEMLGKGLWLEVGSRSLGKIAGNSFALAIGWVIHVFLV